MAAQFTKEFLTGLPDGQPLVISATAGSYQTVHTVSPTAGVIDEVWLYAQNVGPNDEQIAITFGARTKIVGVILKKGQLGLILVVPGLVLRGGSGGIVEVFTNGTANVCSVVGFVNRITP